jgi:hypothetical protein
MTTNPKPRAAMSAQSQGSSLEAIGYARLPHVVRRASNALPILEAIHLGQSKI